MLNDKDTWAGKTLSCAGWKGTVAEVAAALESVSGVKTRGGTAMPTCFRRLFLNDLHAMCEYFEKGYENTNVSIAEFKKVVPDAMGPAEWFKYHGFYSNGQPIVPQPNAGSK